MNKQIGTSWKKAAGVFAYSIVTLLLGMNAYAILSSDAGTTIAETCKPGTVFSKSMP